MKRKTVIYFLITILLVGSAYVAGHFRLLPTHYIYKLNNFAFNHTDRNDQIVTEPDGVEFKSTLLTRLLVKKIPLPFNERSGGGVSVSNDVLFVVSNKGIFSVFDTNKARRLETEITLPPLNYAGLIESGHTSQIGFREYWFRVNGVHSERITEDRYILYISHNRYHEAGDCISHDVSKIELEIKEGKAEQIDTWKTLFSAEPCFDPNPAEYVASRPYSGHISGGAMQTYDDQHLLITVGDYNHHGLGGMPGFAQDPDVAYGKYLLVDKNSGEWNVFAMGTRNPSGLHIDNDGTIWAVENGPQGGDELNIIEQGDNYGWPLVSHGIWYSHSPEYKLQETSSTGRHSGFGFSGPIYSWLPSVAPSSVLRLENDLFQLWTGDLIVGTMRNKGLRRLRLSSNNQVIYDEEINFGHRIRDMVALDSGKIVLLTDDHYLIILSNGGPSTEDHSPVVNDRIAELQLFDNFTDNYTSSRNEKQAGDIFDQKCGTCHSLSPPSGIGPHLEALYGREVGAAEDFDYSISLRRDTRVWDRNLLHKFLSNPDTEFEENRMSRVELTESELDSLVKYISHHPGYSN